MGSDLGNITDFEMLFRTYYQPLCKYAYTFLQSREDAEEVVQATFAQLWEKRDELAIRTSIKPYLYATVRNSCLNALKHEKVRQRYAGEEMARAGNSENSVAHMVVSRELEQHIHLALEALPEQCRMVFKLSRFEAMRYSDISRELNISVKTVENHMGKALRLMRERLREYLPATLLLMITLWN